MTQKNSGLKNISAIATLLMGLCCDVVIFRNQKVDLISTISLCRHQLRTFRSSLLFFLFSSIALSLQQIFSLFFLRPNIFSLPQTFLFTVVYVPVIALSLMTSTHKQGDNRDEIAPKNVPSAPKRLIRRAVIYFSINFLPSLLFVSFIYCSILLVYLCVLSTSFVYFRHNCWTKLPFRNSCWMTAVFFVIFVQVY
ncbi:unnamed protein product [Gongylonema pulchrum]|uniref:Uncharacterized protein n=1 Tax=Gongylonema pulchrum TaxID=637853 RepID=A0A3P7LQJ0_9BILA|nr:unnamed protein product [Gongylonema pulchrum]